MVAQVQRGQVGGNEVSFFTFRVGGIAHFGFVHGLTGYHLLYSLYSPAQMKPASRQIVQIPQLKDQGIFIANLKKELWIR